MKENEEPDIWKCNNCGEIFVPSLWNGFKCPACGSRDAKPIDL